MVLQCMRKKRAKAKLWQLKSFAENCSFFLLPISPCDLVPYYLLPVMDKTSDFGRPEVQQSTLC